MYKISPRLLRLSQNCNFWLKRKEKHEIVNKYSLKENFNLKYYFQGLLTELVITNGEMWKFSLGLLYYFYGSILR